MLGGDYSLQGQPTGFFDQSSLLFNNGSAVGATTANPRKRGRDSALAPINLFSLQTQPSQPTIVNLAQLHNQNPSMVSTGLRLAFEDQQHHQNTNLFPSNMISSCLPEDFSAQIKQQRDEIDQFLQTQREQLRRTLAEKQQKHYRALMGAVEESAERRLREKEAEVEKATRQNADLEERAAQLKVEAHVWQAKARDHEAAAVALQAQLQQAIMRVGAQDNRDEVGCAGGETQHADDAESAYIDPDRPVSVPVCRACLTRAVSVVLLPCRHLCLCTTCDAAVDACPVCFSVRSASVEVYLA
eukprot:TRINITY_DN10304_c0_g1_i1.p1 TRINITY_DN10304_c0_g1~~TRINITY_DN10304_c0_g1_i1.p1  ORF type:complete len:300 (+),score=15.05 TRINITY_DN10304_c0_g1_i1:124-1023(+)